MKRIRPRVWLGDSERAIDHLQRAMRLSPVDILMFLMQGATATAHFIAGRDDEAFAWAEKSAQRNPFIVGPTRIAAASAAYLGLLRRLMVTFKKDNQLAARRSSAASRSSSQ